MERQNISPRTPDSQQFACEVRDLAHIDPADRERYLARVESGARGRAGAEALRDALAAKWIVDHPGAPL